MKLNTIRIMGLYIEFFRMLLKTGLSLSKGQLNTCLHIIKEMTSYIPRLEKISIQKTADNEIQLTRRIPRGYASLIVDEFGGVTYLVMREKGFGYKCEYFDADKLDKRTIYNLLKNFHSI